MDFFGHQARARRRSGLLLALFALAVAAVAGAVWGLVFLGLGEQAKQPEIVLWTLGGAAGLISLGSLYRSLTLRAAGPAVAAQLGGRLLDPAAARDPLERRLLNVVEEMALASGTPVPPVYVLDNEPGINAFAAGRSPGDAVIGITRGALEKLSRDELQGVIAHEFSHILNGDMRLNIRLIALLHGILLIALAGRLLIETAGRSRPSSSSKNDSSPLVFLLFGLGLLIIGSIGVFFGRLIQAAVSRQREFLADASAVQFTRNPDGIAGALKKIGALAAGSGLKAVGADEVSHMFFADGLRRWFGGLLATHPPLLRRIRVIEPAFDGDFARWLAAQPPPGISSARPSSPAGGRRASGPALGLPGLPPLPGMPAAAAFAPGGEDDASAAGDGSHRAAPGGLLARAGQIDPRAGEALRRELAELPGEVHAACEEIYGAAALLTALVLSDDASARAEQTGQIEEVFGGHFAGAAARLAALIQGASPGVRLALSDRLTRPLRGLSRDQYAALARVARALIEADGKVSLFEWALERSVLRLLDQHFGLAPLPREPRRKLAELAPQARLVLAFLAAANSPADGGAALFNRAAALLPGLAEKDRVPPPRHLLTLADLDAALEDLAELEPPARRYFLEAVAVVVTGDGRLLPEETALVRALARSLDCPIPPAAPSV